MKHEKCRWQTNGFCKCSTSDAFNEVVNDDANICLMCSDYYPLDDNELFDNIDNDSEIMDFS